VYYQDRTLLHRHAGLNLELLLCKFLIDNYIYRVARVMEIKRHKK
jgi:hypothetical protein